MHCDVDKSYYLPPHHIPGYNWDLKKSDLYSSLLLLDYEFQAQKPNNAPFFLGRLWLGENKVRRLLRSTGLYRRGNQGIKDPCTLR